MSVKKRADNVNWKELTKEEKNESIDLFLKQCSKVLITTPPMRDKKSITKLRNTVSFRQKIEIIQEFEKLYDIASSLGLYESKAECRRAIDEVGLFVGLYIFEAIAINSGAYDKIEEFRKCKDAQVKFQTIARADMMEEMMMRYEEIRRSLVEKNPADLARRLSEIERQEAEHMEILKPSPEEDDKVINIRLDEYIAKDKDRIYG